MMAPEGEGFGILRMSLKYVDWNQGVNACRSIFLKQIRHIALQPVANLLHGLQRNVLLTQFQPMQGGIVDTHHPLQRFQARRQHVMTRTKHPT